jgi:gas vesicle protein
MYNDDEGTKFSSFIAGLICGLVAGAGVALMLAPESGQRTRKRLKRVAGELKETAGDRWDDLADEVRGRVEDVLEGARSRLG